MGPELRLKGAQGHECVSGFQSQPQMVFIGDAGTAVDGTQCRPLFARGWWRLQAGCKGRSSSSYPFVSTGSSGRFTLLSTDGTLTLLVP